MTIEDLIQALHQSSTKSFFTSPWVATAPQHAIYPQVEALSQWDHDFVASIATHVMHGKPLSTEQDKIFRRIAARCVDDLSTKMRCSNQDVNAALCNPKYRQSLYVSRDVPRQARFVSGHEIALRFKKNTTILGELQKLFLLSNPHGAVMRWSREASVWVVTVDVFNSEQICDILGRYHFDVDDESLALLDRLQPPLADCITFDYAQQSRSLTVSLRNPSVFAWWLRNQNAEPGVPFTPTPALARKLCRLQSILASDLPAPIVELAECDRLTEADLAACPIKLTDHEVGVVQKILDQELRAILPIGDDVRARMVALAALTIRKREMITVLTNKPTVWTLVARQFGYAAKLNVTDGRDPFVIIVADSDVTINDIAERRAGSLITDVTAARAMADMQNPYAYNNVFPYVNATKDFSEVIMMLSVFGGVSNDLEQPIGSHLPSKLQKYIKNFHHQKLIDVFRSKSDWFGARVDVMGDSLTLGGMKSSSSKNFMPLYDVITDLSV